MGFRDYFSSGFDISNESLTFGDHSDAEAISAKILHAYSRYMIRKYELGFYSHYSMPSVPYFTLYLSHINGLILRAISINKINLEKGKKSQKIIWLASGCRELDILSKRYIKRKYNLDVSLIRFSFKYLNSSGYYYKPRRIGLRYFIWHLLSLYRPIKSIDNEIKFSSRAKEKSLERIMFLGHESSASNAPFNYLPERIKDFISNKNITLVKLLPREVGIKNSQRIASFFETCFKVNKLIKKGKTINFKGLHFMFFYFASVRHEKNLVQLMEKLKIKFLITAYFDLIYGPNYTRAAKKLRIKHFTYCFSMGYPFKEKNLLRYSIDTRRYSDIIFANSKIRFCQYTNANLHLKNPPKVVLHPCAQKEFSEIEANNIEEIKDLNNKLTLAIVDNIFSKDLYITDDDRDSLFKILANYKNQISLIIQSKQQDFLSKNIKLAENNFNIIDIGKKTNLSHIKKADLVLSISFQGAALKACSAFHKPLLIFTKYKRDLTNSKFINSEKENELVKDNLDYLWNDEKQLKNAIEQIILDKSNLNQINQYTRNILQYIGIESSNNIIEYLNKYLK